MTITHPRPCLPRGIHAGFRARTNRAPEWFHDTQADRAALLTANVAAVLASYIRMLGHEARAHTATTSDVDLNRLGVSAGLCSLERIDGRQQLVNPYVGSRFGLAAITTTLEIEPDQHLGPNAGRDGWRSHGPNWWLGKGTARRAANAEPYRDREFRMGALPFEKIKRRDTPTTMIDEERVPRFPQALRFLRPSPVWRYGQKRTGSRQGRHVCHEKPDRRMRPARPRRPAAAPIR